MNSNTNILLYNKFPWRITSTRKVAGIYIVRFRNNKTISAVGYDRFHARHALLMRLIALGAWEGMLFPSRNFIVGDRVKIDSICYRREFGTVTGVTSTGGVWVRTDGSVAHQLFSPQEIRKLFPWEC